MLKLINMLYYTALKKKKKKLIYSIIKNYYICYYRKSNLHFILNAKNLIHFYMYKEFYKYSVLNIINRK